MAKKPVDPNTAAFNKLYLFNLLSIYSIKAMRFEDGKTQDPYLYSLIDKMHPYDVNFLIQRIENKL